MVLNERGTVPTLKHGQQVMKTYEEILQYLDKTYREFNIIVSLKAHQK